MAYVTKDARPAANAQLGAPHRPWWPGKRLRELLGCGWIAATVRFVVVVIAVEVLDAIECACKASAVTGRHRRFGVANVVFADATVLHRLNHF